MRYETMIKMVMALAVLISINGLATAEEAASHPNHEASTTNGGLWLSFDFEEGIAPSGGAFKNQVTPHFTREGVGIGPDGVEFDENTPRLVDGLQGQGLYLGGETRNLLKPDLADIAFKGGQITGIDAVKKAKLEQVADDDAWFGENVLKVKTPKKLGAGIAIPLQVSGGGCYVFSLYVKGTGTLKLAMSSPEAQANDIGTSRKITLTSSWTRHAVWIYALESTSATVILVTTKGKRSEFFIDGLQLEKKKKVNANFEKKQYPYGRDFSPGPWVEGRKKTASDSFYLKWSKGGSFPVKEGAYSVWFKPEFYSQDCEAHSILARYYEYQEFGFQSFSTYGFTRGDNIAENKAKNNVSRIRIYRKTFGLKKGKWCHLAATWSNKDRKVKLYFNGELIGEVLSQYGVDAVQAQRLLYVGTYGSVLNGTLDDVKIFAQALTSEQVNKEYERGQKVLAQGE